MERLSLIGAELLSETLDTYDKLTRQPQNHEQATFAPIMKRADGLINWNMKAAEIANRVRGFQPFPTSFTYFKGQKLTVWKAGHVSGFESQVLSGGEVLEAKGDSFIVSCGEETFLEIKELQIEGKRRVSTRDFLNGVKIQPGDHLGE